MVQTIDHDTLATLAEMGVTIIGIAGLVAVFLSRGMLDRVDRVRFLMIVLPAGMTAIGSYVPLWFARHLNDPASVWQYSAWTVGLAVVFSQFLLNRSGYGYGSEFSKAYRLIVSPYSFWGTTAVFAAILLLMGANGASWPFQSNQTIHELVLMLMMTQATLQFVSMVFFRSGDAQAPAS
jgi:hypothetical protein